MKKLVGALLVIGVVLNACSTSDPVSATKVTGAPDVLKIGTSLPLTGADAASGNIIRDAYELYIKGVNDKGGLNIGGKQVKVVLAVEDSKSDAAVGVANYEKLINIDNVHLLLGGGGTGAVVQEVKTANRLRVPYITGTEASASIFEGNTWAFGVLAPVEKLAATQLEFIKGEQDSGKLPKPLKIAVVYEDTSHGKEFYTGLQEGERLAPERFKLLFAESYPPGTKDYVSQLNRVASVNADAFMVDARDNDFVALHDQYMSAKMYHAYQTYGLSGFDKSAREKLGSKSDYLITATGFDSLQPGEKVRTWLDLWKTTGNDPVGYAGSSWEAVRILLEAVSKAGTLERQKIRDVIAKTDWRDSIFPSGVVKFGVTGQAQNDYVLVQNTPNGARVLVWPKSVATAVAVLPVPKR